MRRVILTVMKALETYIRDRLTELHAVTWPTKKQATHAMIVVITIMLIVGFGLTAVDYALNEGIMNILNR